jgi:hypothetical protein
VAGKKSQCSKRSASRRTERANWLSMAYRDPLAGAAWCVSRE